MTLTLGKNGEGLYAKHVIAKFLLNHHGHGLLVEGTHQTGGMRHSFVASDTSTEAGLANAITRIVWARGLGGNGWGLRSNECVDYKTTVAGIVLPGAINQLLLREGHQTASGHLPRILTVSKFITVAHLTKGGGVDGACRRHTECTCRPCEPLQADWHCFCRGCNFGSIIVGAEIDLWNFDPTRLGIAEICGYFEALNNVSIARLRGSLSHLAM